MTNVLFYQLRPAPKTVIYENTTAVHLECIRENAYFMQFYVIIPAQGVDLAYLQTGISGVGHF